VRSGEQKNEISPGPSQLSSAYQKKRGEVTRGGPKGQFFEEGGELPRKVGSKTLGHRNLSLRKRRR